MKWQIDPAHSCIEFSARHLMITTVRGRFEKFSGTVDFDEAHPALTKVNIQIEADSLTTGDPKRDAHLKSADFFYAEEYPQVLFKSKRVEVLDPTHGMLVGDLTIRDVTREVSLPVEYTGQAKLPWGVVNAGFAAKTRLLRKDWDLNWNLVLEAGALLVSEEVTINIELELTRLVEQPQPAEAVVA